MLKSDKTTKQQNNKVKARCYIMSDYAILDQLEETSERNKEIFIEKHPDYDATSSIEKQEESFNGSADTLQFYIFKNYFSKSGVVDLAIIIRETPSTGGFGDFKLTNVEAAVYPLYSAKEGAFDDITAEVAPVLEKDVEDFIREKRSLPKKPYGAEVEFDPSKYRWSVDRIAENLGISNRTVSKYCRCKCI